MYISAYIFVCDMQRKSECPFCRRYSRKPMQFESNIRHKRCKIECVIQQQNATANTTSGKKKPPPTSEYGHQPASPASQPAQPSPAR